MIPRYLWKNRFYLYLKNIYRIYCGREISWTIITNSLYDQMIYTKTFLNSVNSRSLSEGQENWQFSVLFINVLGYKKIKKSGEILNFCINYL